MAAFVPTSFLSSNGSGCLGPSNVIEAITVLSQKQSNILVIALKDAWGYSVLFTIACGLGLCALYLGGGQAP